MARKGRRRGRGRWEHTGSVGPFKGSFMGWGEAETKRPRRRDTARASLGGDTQTEQAGRKPGSGREMGERRPQWTTTHPTPSTRPGLAPTWLSPGAVVPPSRAPSRGRTGFRRGAAASEPPRPRRPSPRPQRLTGRGRGIAPAPGGGAGIQSIPGERRDRGWGQEESRTGNPAVGPAERRGGNEEGRYWGSTGSVGWLRGTRRR